MKFLWLTLFTLLLPMTLSAKATLTLDGASTDSTITINYVVPVWSSHVQVMVVSTGGIHAAPQYGFQAPGYYTIVIDKSGFPTGSYSVKLILDHDRGKVTRRGFLHSTSERPVTLTREERDLWNRCFASTMFKPEKAVEMWNELITRNPDYAERARLFSTPSWPGFRRLTAPTSTRPQTARQRCFRIPVHTTQ